MTHPPANTDSIGARRRVHLVLGAGGVKCISYAGAVAALVEQGFEFASLSGASAGSFIGAILCSQAGLEGFQKAAREFELSSLGEGASSLPLWKLWKLMHQPFAKYPRSLVAQRFREIVGGNPKFKELTIPFATFAVDLYTQRMHLYSSAASPEMAVADALTVSTAVPFLFPAQEIGESTLLDGALVSQCPVWLATAYDDELPILVLRPRKTVARGAPAGVLDYLTRLIDLGGGSRDLYLTEQMPRVRTIEIDSGDVKFDQFHIPADVRRSLIAAGRAAVESERKDLLQIPTAQAPAPALATAPQRPEAAAKAAIQSLVNALPAKRDQVFISYSRKNTQFLHLLQTILQPYTWNRSLNLWTDQEIPPGANWEAEIKNALACAKVAVLLVTKEYLASDFIKNVELPEFVRAAKEDGLTLLWVLVGTCGYKETALATYQALNDVSQPLNAMTEPEQEKELVRICEEISKALTREDTIRPKSA